MIAKRINYVSWFLRVFAWDGLMPAFIYSTPFLVNMLFPNNRNAMEFAGIMLPLVGFIVRFFVGRHYIFSNGCRRIVRLVQFCILCVGIFSLIIIDTMIVLFHGREKDSFVTIVDYLVFGCLLSIYLFSMIIAMYPGRTLAPEEESFSAMQTNC